MVLDGIGWYWIVLDGLGWYRWYCMVLDISGGYWVVIDTTQLCTKMMSLSKFLHYCPKALRFVSLRLNDSGPFQKLIFPL